MFSIKNFIDNNDIQVIDNKGPFTTLEYLKDLTVLPQDAQTAFFCNKMNIRKRQVLVNLNRGNVTIQSGAMQWMVGDVTNTTGLKSLGDALKKYVRSFATKEKMIKPEYVGTGVLVLEPTYKHLILLDVAEWNGEVVLDDGLFLACSSTLEQKAVARSTFSSAVAGNEGLFNLGLQGEGIVCLESPIPQSELVEITLEDDVLKLDGNLAVAWSGSLEFTVERSGKTLTGSAASGEGLVNVYRGTGKVLISPVAATPFQTLQTSTPQQPQQEPSGNTEE